MKKIITLFLFTISAICPAMAQDGLEAKLDSLYEHEMFEEVIAYADSADNYPAGVLYTIGTSYFAVDNDSAAIRFLNLALQQDSSYSSAYYAKGRIEAYNGRFENAIYMYQAAISIEDSISSYYADLGVAYYYLEDIDNAVKAYKKAISFDDTEPDNFAQLAEIYFYAGENDSAMVYYAKAREVLPEESGVYATTLYNTGLLHLLNDEYSEAKEVLNKLVSLTPEDYSVYPKLIQSYWGLKEYDEADTLIDKLYEAYENGLLPDDMDSFCFHQFTWEDKLVMAFERFEEPEGRLYYKHVFYLTEGNSGDIILTVQTEYFAISKELGGPSFLLGKQKGNAHYTYSVGVEEDVDYETLEKLVVKILDGELKPSAASVLK